MGASRNIWWIGFITIGMACLLRLPLASGRQTAKGDPKAELNQRNEWFNQALQLQGRGKALEAIALLQKVLNSDEQRNGRLASATLNTCYNLANALHAARQLEDADRVLRDLAARYEESPDKSSPEQIKVLTSLGYLQGQINHLDRSEPFHRRAVALAIKAGRHDGAQASAFTGLGKYFLDVGEPTRALAWFNEARTILQGIQAQHTQQYVLLLNSLGANLAKLDRVDESQKIFEEALALFADKKSHNDPDYLLTLKNKGVLCIQANRLEDAQRHILEALDINQKLLGPLSESNADFLLDLGQVALLKGDYRQAETLTRRARWMLASTSNQVQKKRATAQLVTILGATGRPGAAFELASEVLELEQTAMEPILNIGSEKGLAEYLGSTHGSLERLCTLANNLQGADPMAADTALTWVLRRKGIVSDLICQFREQEGTALRDPSITSIASNLRARRADLAQAALDSDPGDKPDQRARIGQLEFQCDQLERELHRQLSAYRTKPTFHIVELDDVRKKLPPQSILIECFTWRTHNFKAIGNDSLWEPAHYFAFVLAAREDVSVQLVDLGPVSAVDRAVQAFRKKFEETPRDLRASDEKSVEEDFRKTSQELHELIFAPLRPHLGDAKLIFLAPDGQLSQLPYEALAGKDSRYLIDTCQFAYLVTGRDLLRPRLKPSSNNSAVAGRRSPAGALQPNQIPGRGADGVVVFAGPDFDLKASDRRQAADAILGKPAAQNLVATRGTTIGDTRGLRWQPLAGAAAEARDIRDSQISARYGSLQMYVGAQALEEVFKRMPAPRVLHIATHGFFLPDKPLSPSKPKSGDAGSELSRGGATLSRLREMRDPMRRSGIVLAGANAVDQENREGMEDGWVTAEEISFMNLQGTELVVLAACESGLGDVRLGEGVFGLRRAFLFAGARTLVTSLFEVPDVETRALMKLFYQELARGATKLDALHTAKQRLKAQRLEKKESAHPYFWASFILVGEPG
jgi:CHAT domain-containing protein/tetratricopeptide (TPR) repeat protein